MSDLFAWRAWLIECSRCAYEAVSDEERYGDALIVFRRLGWTAGHGRQFCPACNRVKQ